MKTLTKEIQEQLTPKSALDLLQKGNKRFVENIKTKRNLIEQVTETSKEQFPFAVIHSCIDSRVPVELVFDQGIGDIFSIRIAGNIINKDILASMEYACKVAGSKIIIVLGHTNCGAVSAACSKVSLGNIDYLLNKINPAIKSTLHKNEIKSQKDIDKVAKANVKNSIKQILSKSEIIKSLKDSKKIEIIGAMYSVNTGVVTFFK